MYMKTIKFSIFTAMAVIFCLAMAIPASAKTKKEAKISFTEDVYDFGKVPVSKGKVSHEFTFTNTGDGNLVITSAKADCGCTRPEYGDEPVAPGKSGKIKVTFVPNGQGDFTKKVTITTNGNPRKARLIIKGEVTK